MLRIQNFNKSLVQPFSLDLIWRNMQTKIKALQVYKLAVLAINYYDFERSPNINLFSASILFEEKQS